MRITAHIFEAYLDCPTKCFLRAHQEAGAGNAYSDWVRAENEAYCTVGIKRLMEGVPPNECATALTDTKDLKKVKWRLAVDVMAQTLNLESRIPAIERMPSEGRGKAALFIPVRFSFRNKLTTNDKLLLAFDTLVLSKTLGRAVNMGMIIHGDDHSTLKVKTANLRNRVGKLNEKIAELLSTNSAPDLALTRHCGECEFQGRCRMRAVEKDDLSLLAGMNDKERRKLHSKGIFTVTQLSYTFRPRRRPKRLRDKKEKYHHPLKALAIREKKIYIVGSPELKIAGTPVYLDVEGIPDRDFYYLIGIQIGNGQSAIHHSLWADNRDHEKRIWAEFLAILGGLDNPVLIHYGSYETTFLKRMADRYNAPPNDSPAARSMTSAINLLSLIFAQIYFPGFSNGLKTVAVHLGFGWTDIDASGLKSIVLRHQWQRTCDPDVKDRLIRYNTEDCEALQLVSSTVTQLLQANRGDLAETAGLSVVQSESIVPRRSSRWSTFKSPLPSLEYATAAAHWDYQRDRIYARSGKVPRQKKLCRLRQRKVKHVDKVILWPVVSICPRCGKHVRIKGPTKTRTLQDIVFGRSSLKKRFIKYIFQTYHCRKCGIEFGFEERYRICRKHGWDLVSYFLYQIIDLCIPQITVVHNYNRLFGYGMHRSSLNNIKAKAASYYTETKQEILDRIVRGNLVHADETRANIKGKSAFVWVLTSLREVVYIYADTREGEIVQHLLTGFKGVLVTDFYTAYESVDCPQQKCLIHLVRDLNDEILSNPFDEELKRIVSTFGELLKLMVASIDRYGLKKHFLRKHLTEVDRFYREIGRMDCGSEPALKCRQRFEKNRDYLFTFLEHDGVPWNNNNAEHAIKAFAALRDVMQGSSTQKGIEEYLILLSICQTCKYQALDFLDFLRSGEKDIEAFARTRRRR